MANIQKRIIRDGKISFHVKVRIKNFSAQTATFQRLTDARKWAQQIETSLREGRYFKAYEAKRHTLTQTIDNYIQKILCTHSKKKRNQLSQLQWWKDTLGDYSLAEITPPLLIKQRDKWLEEETKHKKLRTPATVNRYFAALSHVFTVAIKEWQWISMKILYSRLLSPKNHVIVCASCQTKNDFSYYKLVKSAIVQFFIW